MVDLLGLVNWLALGFMVSTWTVIAVYLLRNQRFKSVEYVAKWQPLYDSWLKANFDSAEASYEAVVSKLMREAKVKPLMLAPAVLAFWMLGMSAKYFDKPVLRFSMLVMIAGGLTIVMLTFVRMRLRASSFRQLACLTCKIKSGKTD